MSQLLAAIFNENLHVDRRLPAKHDKRKYVLAQFWMRHGEHRRLLHGGMLDKDVFDLDRSDLVAAAHDHVLHPVDMVEVTFRIHISEIAGVKPSASECFRGRFGIAMIATHDTWPSNKDLPSFARFDVTVGLVGDSHLAQYRSPYRSEMLVENLRRQIGTHSRRFRHPIDLTQPDPREACVRPIQCRHRNRRRAEAEQPDGLERMSGRIELLGHKDDDCGHYQQHRSALGAHTCKSDLRVKRRIDYQRCTGIERPHSCDKASRAGG